MDHREVVMEVPPNHSGRQGPFSAKEMDQKPFGPSNDVFVGQNVAFGGDHETGTVLSPGILFFLVGRGKIVE